jgi:hypothetical protein
MERQGIFYANQQSAYKIRPLWVPFALTQGAILEDLTFRERRKWLHTPVYLFENTMLPLTTDFLRQINLEFLGPFGLPYSDFSACG